LQAAGGLKEQGNVAFKAGGVDMALAMYTTHYTLNPKS